MNDKELDDFFNKLSSSPEIPYVPQDWNSFKKILGKNKLAHPLNGFKWILLGSLVMVGFLLAIWMTVTSSQIQTEVNSNSSIDSSSTQPESDVLNKKEVAVLGFNIASNELSKHNEEQVGSIHFIKLIQSKTNLPISNETVKVEKHQIPHLNWDYGSKWEIFEEFNRSWPMDKNFKIQDNSLVQIRDKSTLIRKNRIALLLMASPDFSAIQFNHIPSSGRNLGASLEYFLDESWSISLGVIHDKKTYRQGEGYWEGYNKVHKSLVGDCWIIEVPLNFRYYPIKRLKHNWFIGSGLSSYFMLKEKYSLLYENYNGNAYSKDIEIIGNNQHVFGIWNIGLGYEQKLGKKFALQAEPYFRLPLVGIGEGNLDLKSMGIFFGVKYYPSIRINKF